MSAAAPTDRPRDRLRAQLDALWRLRRDLARERADERRADELDVLLRELDRSVEDVLAETERVERSHRRAARLEALGRLATGIAHDFNNLLTPILGYSELLMPPDEAAREARYAREIRKAAQRAEALTRRLLAFSRRASRPASASSAGDLVADLETMLRRILGEDIELALETTAAVESLDLDPTELEQIVLGLAVRARTLMPRGGRLRIETRSVELDEAAARRQLDIGGGRYVVVVASDTASGGGIARSGPVRPEALGEAEAEDLAAILALVRRRGGAMTAYAEPGRGTTIKIYLPAGAGAPALAAEERPSQGASASEATILVVEDDADVRGLAREILDASGYRVLEAASGEEALRVARRHAGAIDLLLTDVVMPRMSGRELRERLGGERPVPRVLYMSGYPLDRLAPYDPDLAESILLQKPFSRAELLGKVREILEGD